MAFKKNETESKKVYLYTPFPKLHSLYDHLINYPPAGYQYIREQKTVADFRHSLYKNPLLRLVNKSIIKKLINPQKIRDMRSKYVELPSGTKLVYSAGCLFKKDFPWVADGESVISFTGYDLNLFRKNKHYLEKTFNSKYCKKIMPWTHAAARTILENLDSKSFMHKVETVHLAVPPKTDFVKKYSNDDKVKFLFVSSANLPYDFEFKGGKEAVEAFIKLSKEYENVEMTVRSWIPDHLRERYKNVRNLKVIENIISWQDLGRLFKEADIFLFPAHSTPGLVFLDAMSYELPIITSNVWGNEEMVKENINGVIIEKSKKVLYYVDNFIFAGSTKEFNEGIKKIDREVVDQIVEKASMLIEKKALRRKMGKKGREMVEQGEFSIQYRNKKLKRIFDESIR